MSMMPTTTIRTPAATSAVFRQSRSVPNSIWQQLLNGKSFVQKWGVALRKL